MMHDAKYLAATEQAITGSGVTTVGKFFGPVEQSCRFDRERTLPGIDARQPGDARMILSRELQSDRTMHKQF